MNWAFITYYTESYRKYFDRLHASCFKHRCTLLPVFLKSSGSWVQNCANKPRVIQHFIENAHDAFDLLVWIDADATVESYPFLFDDFDAPLGVAKVWHRPHWEFLSGTLPVNRWTGRAIIDAWVRKQALEQNTWDQKVLQELLETGEFDYVDLDPAYCCIFDKQEQLEACNHQPVILHHQASREMKRLKRV